MTFRSHVGWAHQMISVTALLLQVMLRLVAGGYQVVTQRCLFPDLGLSREEAACVEYYAIAKAI